MTDHRIKDEALSALSVVLLLIGTATGNAVVMMVMSVTMLAVLLVCHRGQVQRGSMLVALVAALTAMVIAGIVALMRR